MHAALKLLQKLHVLVSRASTSHDPKMLNVGAALLVFLLALGSDFLETRYVRAVRAWEDGDEAARAAAAASSVSMWLIGCIGLIAVVEVGWWVLFPEGLGLYAGTMLALRR